MIADRFEDVAYLHRDRIAIFRVVDLPPQARTWQTIRVSRIIETYRCAVRLFVFLSYFSV